MGAHNLKALQELLNGLFEDPTNYNIIQAQESLNLTMSLTSFITCAKKEGSEYEKRISHLKKTFSSFQPSLSALVAKDEKYAGLYAINDIFNQEEKINTEDLNITFEDIKKVSKNEAGEYIISFNDGGVGTLVSSNKEGSVVVPLISTHQFLQFSQRLSEPHEEIFTQLDLIEKSNIGISQVRNIDEDKFSSYKEYILDNGEVFILNSHGIIDKNKNYFSFEEFLENNKSRLSEDAYFEFNKYTVKQDTGSSLINPFNLDISDVSIDDIITALSGINRFAGQTKLLQEEGGVDFYTVGQHTLAMYRAIKETPELVGLENVSLAERNVMAKQALLHEAFEGITGTDLITPFKYATKKNEYKIAEVEAEMVMEKAFGMPLMTPELKKIDKMMAATEGHYLVGQSNVKWDEYGGVLPKESLLLGFSQLEVKEKLKEVYQKEGLYEVLESYKNDYRFNLKKDVVFGAKLAVYKEAFAPLGFNENQIESIALLKHQKLTQDNGVVSVILDNGATLVANSDVIGVKTSSLSFNALHKDDCMFEHNLKSCSRLDYSSSSEMEVSQSQEIDDFLNNQNKNIGIISQKEKL